MVHIFSAEQPQNVSVYHQMPRNHLNPMGRDRGLSLLPEVVGSLERRGNDAYAEKASNASSSPSYIISHKNSVIHPTCAKTLLHNLRSEFTAALGRKQNPKASPSCRGNELRIAQEGGSGIGGAPGSLHQINTQGEPSCYSRHSQNSGSPHAALHVPSIPAAPPPLLSYSGSGSSFESISGGPPSRGGPSGAGRDCVPSHLKPLAHNSTATSTLVGSTFSSNTHPHGRPENMNDRKGGGGVMVAGSHSQNSSVAMNELNNSGSYSKSDLHSSSVEGRKGGGGGGGALPLSAVMREGIHENPHSSNLGPRENAGGEKVVRLSSTTRDGLRRGDSFLARPDSLPPLDCLIPKPSPGRKSLRSYQPGCAIVSSSKGVGESTETWRKKGLPPIIAVSASSQDEEHSSVSQCDSAHGNPHIPPALLYLPQSSARPGGGRPSFTVAEILGSPKLGSMVKFSSNFPTRHHGSFSTEEASGIMSSGCSFTSVIFTPPPNWVAASSKNEKENVTTLVEKVKPEPAFSATLFSPQSQRKKK